MMETIHQNAVALAQGETTSVALCQAALDRIAAVDGRVGAFLHVDREAVLAAAAASDRRRGEGEARSPYDGVPVALKDNMAVTGQPCTCGSKILESFVSP
ncbi:MAG: amidase family protein, partial [Lentisphaeria bacterium]|nr:amidase family protein [Lentisphaeria bacterium]